MFSALLPVRKHLAGEPTVLDRALPRGQVPAIGFETIRSPCTDTSVSGLAPTILRSSWRSTYMYGEGFTSRSAAYSPSESTSPRSSRLREITP